MPSPPTIHDYIDILREVEELRWQAESRPTLFFSIMLALLAALLGAFGGLLYAAAACARYGGAS